MKRTFLILVVALLTLSSCWEQTPEAEESRTYALSSLRFNFTIHQLETKGIKSGWESGDKVFIIFSGVNTAYVTMSYNGSTWTSTTQGEANLNQTGTLTALYLPYGNNETPAYTTDKWQFSSGTESYFLKAEKVDYYIRDMESQAATLGAKLEMTKGNACTQFYVPKTPGENETMQLACNVVTPTGLASIAADGTIALSSGSSRGGWMTGHAATVGGEQGFYFYGIIAQTPGSSNYFALKDNSGSYYKHYYKGSTTLLAHKSYQLPAFDDWPGVGDDVYVNVAGHDWFSLDQGASTQGASTPLATGTQYANLPSAAGSKLVPSSEDWNDLLDNATCLPMTISGVTGVLMVDVTYPSQFFYLHSGDYWCSTSGYYFNVSNDGTAFLRTGTPNTAYVRWTLSVTSGDITDPENGGEI